MTFFSRIIELLRCEFYGDLIIIYLARSYGFCRRAMSFCFSDEKKEFNARKNSVVRVENPLHGLTDFMGYRTNVLSDPTN